MPPDAPAGPHAIRKLEDALQQTLSRMRQQGTAAVYTAMSSHEEDGVVTHVLHAYPLDSSLETGHIPDAVRHGGGQIYHLTDDAFTLTDAWAREAGADPVLTDR